MTALIFTARGKRRDRKSDGKADFYFLNPGKYSARLINVTNGNGVWDTGKYEDKRQPEKVYYYPQVIELKANFDLTQDWNIHEKPLDKQKPDELKKQKPDEDKKKRNQNNRSSGNNRSARRGVLPVGSTVTYDDVHACQGTMYGSKYRISVRRARDVRFIF